MLTFLLIYGRSYNMSTKVPSQAAFYGIQEHGFKHLYVTLYWLNGKELTYRGEDRRISTHHDIPLKEMYRGIDWDYDKASHERLLDKGIFEETYVARRKIDWALTQLGRQAVRDIFDSNARLKPSWHRHTERRAPLYGDVNEGVTHRKSVLVAAYLLPGIPWAYDIHSGPYGFEYYPTDSRGEFTHDFHLTTREGIPNVGVEAITDHNNTDQIIKKWKRYQKKDRITFWVFDRRETAARLYNALDKRDEFYLDRGTFDNLSNWATKSINRKIWRSSLKYRDEQASDVVFTLTEILEGGKDAIEETFDDYLSYI